MTKATGPRRRPSSGTKSVGMMFYRPSLTRSIRATRSKLDYLLISMGQFHSSFLFRADEGDSKLDKYTKKGEGWKRLQLIAQSRVNTDPDKVNQYPSHKFPLKD